MNKKNKNKNRNKPTNLVPHSQKAEASQITEEAITEFVEENPVSSVKDSDCVIEITNEVMDLLQENEKVPIDTPKKPKRNKGKKKKQEEASLDENKLSSIESQIMAPSTTDSEVIVKDESTVQSTDNKSEVEDNNLEENITVNVRKKKNKKKPIEQQKIEESSRAINDEKMEQDLKNKESVTDKAVESDNTPETLEPDIKNAKKKNKKKKHQRDSEKSDKGDEITTCTAAFQKLISSTDNEEMINPDTSNKISTDNEEDKNKLSTDNIDSLKELIDNVLLPEEKIPEYDHLHESKNKKKNKKDKKQQQNIEKSKETEEQINNLTSMVESSNIVQDVLFIENAECESKDISKTKAKIAKPVEKKRKGKTDSLEIRQSKLIEDMPSAETDFKEPILETEKMSELISTPPDLCSINIENTNKAVKTEGIQKNQVTVITSEQPSDTQTLTEIMSPSTVIVDSNLYLADINIDGKSNEESVISSVTTPDPILLEFDKKTESNLNKLVSELPVITDKDASISLEPYKTVEKKKKKHQKKMDTPGEKTCENKVLTTPKSENIKEKIPLVQKEDIFSGSSSIGDVEISSLNPDELGGSSDATPDFIQHPLATSQQLIDGNNNLIISELTSSDEKISLHLLIPNEPIIHDSGETPEPVSEKKSEESRDMVMPTDTNVTSEPEKTDLKSKMMEVSQDMEELRLSIERSLAELTSMEKSEQNVEKELEENAATKLITATEHKICIAKDNISEKNICENILDEKVLKDTHAISDASTKPVDPKQLESQIEIIKEKSPATAKSGELIDVKETPPQIPARKDHKGKGKGKKKGKLDTQPQQTTSVSETTASASSENGNKVKQEEKEESKQKSQSSESNDNKSKQQHAMQFENRENTGANDPKSSMIELSYEPIENFEDALTSSVDDVNKTFEIIASEVNNTPEVKLQNPQISVTSPIEEPEPAEPKQNPVSPSKNLLGHPDIPVPSNRTDYKKEKNKLPNMRQAKVKIKDADDVEKTEKTKESKESQTDNRRKNMNNKIMLESFAYMTNGNAEYVYKYSFRKVFLQSLCHVCRKELGQRIPCQFCSLVFYCSQKHKEEDWPQHQSLCFAICTIAHLKDQKHIYADTKNITGQRYRMLRMQMIISCEKVLKRKLVPWEQEALLYPRICADVACREWKQNKLNDCENCGQISYCLEHPDHLPSSHQRWCRSYALYQKLVHHQQTRGKLEPKIPTRIVEEGYKIPEKINEVLAVLYDEKIDMTDTEYATLTQLATAPLTTAYCHQIATANHTNGITKKAAFVVHIVGAELQFEADVLFKWETFLLHLKPAVKELQVVLVSPDLNPSNLPLNLLEQLKWCGRCAAEQRRVLFNFRDKMTYNEFWASDEFLAPDIVCAFNPSIQRSSLYSGKDTWPTTVSCILKLKTPFVVSSYSIDELNRDVAWIKECSELSGLRVKIISEPKCNPFASVRPDRNFITDDEIPLLFKNYCFVVLCGV